jgi:hypothetical protein
MPEAKKQAADGGHMNTSTEEIGVAGEGVYLSDLPVGEELEVRTRNRTYRVVNLGGGEAWISGHPHYCPEPVRVKLQGSTWGGSCLRPGYIGVGMHLEFLLPEHNRVTTSTIDSIGSAITADH